jgi:hypothetical protein
MRLSVSALLAASLTALSPSPARACACCTDRGFRYESRSHATAYEKGELARIRFGNHAELFMDESDGSGTGIEDPSADYRLKRTRKGSRWTFWFEAPNGKKGTLAFTQSATLDRFAVDPRNGEPGPNGPILYKEWRMKARVTATGVFAKAVGKGSSIELVLQGHGLACDDATQFTHFTLVVSGPGGSFMLFGDLAAPGA